MFSRLIVDTASVILAASGLGLVCGGVLSSIHFSRPLSLEGPAERMIRESGYFGAAAGVAALLFDLTAGLY